MPDEVTWTVSEPSGETKTTVKRKPVPYSDKIKVTDKMPKGQVAFADLFNSYRERLILLGEMEEK